MSNNTTTTTNTTNTNNTKRINSLEQQVSALMEVTAKQTALLKSIYEKLNNQATTPPAAKASKSQAENTKSPQPLEAAYEVKPGKKGGEAVWIYFPAQPIERQREQLKAWGWRFYKANENHGAGWCNKATDETIKQAKTAVKKFVAAPDDKPKTKAKKAGKKAA